MPSALQPAESQVSKPLARGEPAQLDALLHHGAIAALDSVGWIAVTGGDRMRWLNGMVTNNIQALAPGQGCYNFVLNAQGRVQGDLTAWMLEDSILLETGRNQLEKLLAHLDRFIIMDDVELADITPKRSGLLLAGPDAPAHLKENGVEVDPLHMTRVRWRSAWIDAIYAHSPLVPRLELWSDPETITALFGTLNSTGVIPVNPDSLEYLRILEGTPRYGIDIRDTATAHDLPQETAQTRALHFAKGCYLGQEIVERIRSRGNVHRTFTGFSLDGILPAPGTLLHAEGKIAGEITSVTAIPLPDSAPIQLALGYIRREAQVRNSALEYPGGAATPVALPYPFS